MARSGTEVNADQASGLRAMFRGSAARWNVVLQPGMLGSTHAQGLAKRARALAQRSGAVLLIDAARSQLAPALGLSLRFDLAHVMGGDCAMSDACVFAGQGLWVLPAARAMDRAAGDEPYAKRVAAAMLTVSLEMQSVMLVLPAVRAGWLRQLPRPLRPRHVLLPVGRGGESASTVLTAVRLGMSEAEIDTFHLLFLGMGGAAAGRLLSGMAAIAQRHFGATLLAARPIADAPAGSEDLPAGSRSVESVS